MSDTLMPRSVHLAIAREVRDLIERAANDIRQGWNEAAQDALGRAQRLLDESAP